MSCVRSMHTVHLLEFYLVLRFKSMPIECFNRYEPLAQLNYSNEAVSSSSNCDKQNGNIYICRCGFSG